MAFSNPEAERKALACCLRDPTCLRQIPTEIFETEPMRKCRDGLEKFFRTYGTTPSVETIVSRTEAEYVEIAPTFIELSQLAKTVDATQFQVYVHDVYDAHCSRVLFVETEAVIRDLPKGQGSKLIDNFVAKLATMKDPLKAGQIDRGFIYERARARWDAYTGTEVNPTMAKGTPFGIQFLDESSGGGLRRGWSVAFRGPTKVGKSKLLLNIGYNTSRYAHAFTMLVSREMSRPWLEMCIDSRDAGIEFNDIKDGKLGEGRNTYGHALAEQQKRKDPLYIVDIPKMCSTADLMAEFELARQKYGQYPEGLILDYAGLVVPVQRYQSQADRFNFLSQELHEFAHTYNCWVVTAYQITESEEAEGGSYTAFSKHIKDHVEIMWSLKADPEMKRKHELKVTIDVSRYSQPEASADICSLYGRNYVGDWGVDIRNLGGQDGPAVGGNAALLQRE